MSEYTQGIAWDGAAILKDGQPMTIEQILSELSASPACSIAVPVEELQQLEQARVDLYIYLAQYLDEQQMRGLPNITKQIWKVANTKNWERQ